MNYLIYTLIITAFMAVYPVVLACALSWAILVSGDVVNKAVSIYRGLKYMCILVIALTIILLGLYTFLGRPLIGMMWLALGAYLALAYYCIGILTINLHLAIEQTKLSKTGKCIENADAVKIISKYAASFPYRYMPVLARRFWL